jgi:hypothetical protein
MSNESIELYIKYADLLEQILEVSKKLREHETGFFNELKRPDVWEYRYLIKSASDYSNDAEESNLSIQGNVNSRLKEILPAIGVINSSYVQFIYHEIFLCGRENEARSLEILKAANSFENLDKLLYHYQELKKDISSNEIPYFAEFLKYIQDQEEDTGKLERFINTGLKINAENKLNKDSYEEHLYNTCNVLGDLGQQLFTCLINVAMSGELKLADEFEVGEVFYFKESDFNNLDDQNAQLIIKVLDMIDNTHSTLININKLDINDEEDEEDEDTPF